VFALSNTSWVIYPWSSKLQFSPVSTPSITNFCKLSKSNNQNNEICVITTPKSLVFGTITKLAQLQKNKYGFHYNIGEMKYIKDIDVYVALFDNYQTGKYYKFIIIDAYTLDGESKIVLFKLDSSNSSSEPQLLNDSVALQKSEFATNMVMREHSGHYYIYVLTVDLTSNEEGSLIEKRGRLLCYQIVPSNDHHLSNTLITNTIGIFSQNSVSLVKKSQFNIEDGCL
jgi:hypothetical protein